ncbi:MAG: glycosyl hydrolase family 28-related protein [Cyclobacteriaceae bacterium]
MKRILYHSTAILFLILLLPSLLMAQYKIPSDANVVNVKEYGARGNGTHDDTQAIQAAIKYAVDLKSRFETPKFIYFPKGTYLISNTLEGRADKNSSNQGWRTGLIMVGEDRTQTIIKLKNNTSGFGSASNPKPLIKTGSENHRGDGQGNEAQRHSIISMTLDMGQGNAGAVGISYLANNRGSVEDVTIKGANAGYCGIRMVREWPGPCLLKNVKIVGFDYGMEFGHIQYGVTMEHITLENQRKAGIYNQKNVLAIRKLTSINKVPAITGMEKVSSVILIDSELKNGDAKNTAITSQGNLIVRNTFIGGYGTAISSNENGGTIQGKSGGIKIDEYHSREPVTQFSTPKRTLNLPIEETPTYHTSDFSKWANINSYGSTANENDINAIQKAIDSGKEIVYLPNGRYKISKPLVIRKNVKKLVGFQASLEKTGNFSGDELIRFDGASSSFTILEHLKIKGKIKHNSSKTLVLRHLDHGGYENTTQGKGKLFVEDVQGKPYRIKYGQKVWARQLNAEKDANPLIKVENSTLWLLGYKTEGPLTVAETIGGSTEVLGGLIYPLGTTSRPAFIAKDAQVSYFVMFNGRTSRGVNEIYVKETQNGTTKTVGGVNRYTPMYVGRASSDNPAPPSPDEELANGLYKIRPVSAPQKVLEVKVAKGNGDNVQQGTDKNQSNQRWQLTRASNGYYQVAPANNLTKGLDVANHGGTANGTNIHIWNHGRKANQQWKLVLENADKGYYSISPRHTEERGLNMRMDISGASQANGANVQLYKSNGSNAQRFILEKVAGGNARYMVDEQTEDSKQKTGLIDEEVLPLRIYPNPSTNGTFTIQGIREDSQIRMYDLQGRDMTIHLQRSGAQRVEVQGASPLPEGLYIVRVWQADGTTEKQKVMIR